MKILNMSRCLMMAAAMTVAASLSHAQTPTQMQLRTQQPTINVGPWYGGLEAGIIIPQDISYKMSGVVGGVVSTVSGNLSFNPGAAGGGFVGYDFNKYLSGEGEFLYGHFDFDKLTANFTGIIAGSAAVSVNGSTDTETFLANAIVNLYGKERDFQTPYGFAPYIGAGVGFMNYDSTINSVSAFGITASYKASSSALDFAADGIAGVDYKLDDSWNFGVRYRFLWVNLSSLGCPAGATCSQGDFMAHLFTANAAYHF